MKNFVSFTISILSCLMLLTAYNGRGRYLTGELSDIQLDDEGYLVSLVVTGTDGKQTGLLMTERTSILSHVNGQPVPRLGQEIYPAAVSERVVYVMTTLTLPVYGDPYNDGLRAILHDWALPEQNFAKKTCQKSIDKFSWQWYDRFRQVNLANPKEEPPWTKTIFWPKAARRTRAATSLKSRSWRRRGSSPHR